MCIEWPFPLFWDHFCTKKKFDKNTKFYGFFLFFLKIFKYFKYKLNEIQISTT